MKQSLEVMCLLCILNLIRPGIAQTPVKMSQTEHLATLSFSAAVLQTAEAQREFGELKSKYAPRQAQLQALNNEIESLRKQLSDDTKVTDSERVVQEKSLDSKEKQLQRQEEDFRNDSQADSQQVYQRIAQKMYAFLQTYSQRKGFSIVLERGSDAEPVVWYAANNMDITDELIKAYNAQAEATTQGKGDGANSSPKSSRPLPVAPIPH